MQVEATYQAVIVMAAVCSHLYPGRGRERGNMQLSTGFFPLPLYSGTPAHGLIEPTFRTVLLPLKDVSHPNVLKVTMERIS